MAFLASAALREMEVKSVIDGTGILEKGMFMDMNLNASDDLMEFIGDGKGFFAAGVGDRKRIAYAEHNKGFFLDGYVFIDVDNDGDFDLTEDMVIRIENFAFGVGALMFEPIGV